MTLHNTLFFKDPVNYQPGRVRRHGTSVIINAATDNSYETFTTETDLDIDISDGSNPTAVTHLFLKYKGQLTSYVATPTGGTGSPFTRTVPVEVINYEGSTISLEVKGFKHDLFQLTSPVTATTMRLVFTGTDLEICALMLLESVYALEANANFTQMDFRKVDRAGRLHRYLGGGARRVQNIRSQRWKWEGSYRYIFAYDTVDAFVAMAEAHTNHVFCQEFTRHPERIYPACFAPQPIAGGYFTPIKPSGEYATFQILER